MKSTAVAKADAQRATNGGSGAPVEAADAYGRFVDHYFNFRLDLDVVGPVNSFVSDRLVTKTLPPGNLRRSIWVRDPMMARTESQAMMHMDMEKPALCRVLSTTRHRSGIRGLLRGESRRFLTRRPGPRHNRDQAHLDPDNAEGVSFYPG